jgi:hypothetical protein
VTDVLSELRQAEATIIPWAEVNDSAKAAGIDLGLSVSVLVEAVLPIIQMSIVDIEKTAEPFRDHIARQAWNEPALRLARFVNERAAS